MSFQIFLASYCSHYYDNQSQAGLDDYTLPSRLWQATGTAWHLGIHNLLISLQRQCRGTFPKVPQIPQDQALELCCFQLTASLIGFPSICFISPSFLFPGITCPVNYWTQAFVLDLPFRRTKAKAKTSCKVTLAGRKMTFKIILLLLSIYILLGECPY